MPLALQGLGPFPRRNAAAGAWLIADTVGAILFAAGLALACAAIAAHRPIFGALFLLIAGGVWRAGAASFALCAAAADARYAKDVVRTRVIGAVLKARPGGALSHGERIGAIVQDVEALDGWFTRYAPAQAAARISPLVVLCAVFAASPFSSAILLGAFIPFLALMALIGMSTASEARGQLDTLSKLSGLFVDRIRALPLILAFGAQAQETGRIERAATEVRGRTLSVLRLAFMSSATLEFFAALSVALAALYIGFNLLHLLPFPAPEHLDLAHAVFVLALAPEIYAPLRRLAAAYHDKQIGEAGAERLALLLSQPRIAEAKPITSTRAPALRFAGAVIEYEDGARVGPFDFLAPAGAITAVLGPSGAGKSSLFASLLGLAPLAQGEAWADELALSEAGSFASLAAYAAQSPLILSTSIADNIAMGDRTASAAAIAGAAERVGLGVLRHRRSFDAALGERGGGLSGGERRRIGLARALLKRAPLLLLDEPTADLDAKSERELMQLFRQLKGTQTILLATHSSRLARLADHVVALA